ncbi:MAG: FKBP-type peptidyl-prolyl cis-trans isomerase [Chitinophagales bacterium]
MKKILCIAAAGAMIAGLGSCKETTIDNVPLKTAQDSLSYAFGVYNGESMKQEKLTEINTEIMGAVMQGVMDGDTANLKMDMNAAMDYIQKYIVNKMQSEGKEWLENNAKNSGVKTTSSGLQYMENTTGNGPKPVSGDSVVVQVVGKLTDGTVFENTYDSGAPITFPVDQFTPGFTEGLELMPAGSKWTLYIPQELAYGPQGVRNYIPPYATVIFEVELLDVISVTK